MIVGFIVESAVGALCIVYGLLIWRRQRLSLLHYYHYKNVKEQDVSAYARLIGIGLLLIGAGICVTGVFNLIKSTFWWIPMLIGFLAGILVMRNAQKKYNGSWFS